MSYNPCAFRGAGKSVFFLNLTRIFPVQYCEKKVNVLLST